MLPAPDASGECVATGATTTVRTPPTPFAMVHSIASVVVLVSLATLTTPTTEGESVGRRQVNLIKNVGMVDDPYHFQVSSSLMRLLAQVIVCPLLALSAIKLKLDTKMLSSLDM